MKSNKDIANLAKKKIDSKIDLKKEKQGKGESPKLFLRFSYLLEVSSRHQFYLPKGKEYFRLSGKLFSEEQPIIVPAIAFREEEGIIFGKVVLSVVRFLKEKKEISFKIKPKKRSVVKKGYRNVSTLFRVVDFLFEGKK